MGCDLFERKHIIYSVITNKYMHSQGALLSKPEIANLVQIVDGLVD